VVNVSDDAKVADVFHGRFNVLRSRFYVYGSKFEVQRSTFYVPGSRLGPVAGPFPNRST
jgi:hypothetical protein